MPLYRQLAYQPRPNANLAELPEELFVVQLLALSSRQRLARFVVDNQLHHMATARIEHEGNPMYVLLAGIYADRETAERAAASLRAGDLDVRPWVRALGPLQQAMRRADQTFGER